jgi:hypothetical protein
MPARLEQTVYGGLTPAQLADLEQQAPTSLEKTTQHPLKAGVSLWLLVSQKTPKSNLPSPRPRRSLGIPKNAQELRLTRVSSCGQIPSSWWNYWKGEQDG